MATMTTTQVDEGTISSKSIKTPGLWILGILGVLILIGAIWFMVSATRSTASSKENGGVNTPLTTQPPAPPPEVIVKYYTVGSDWVTVDPVLRGWSMKSDWDNAPFDIMINDRKVIEWPDTQGQHDRGHVWSKKYRMSSKASGTWKVRCIYVHSLNKQIVEAEIAKVEKIESTFNR